MPAKFIEELDYTSVIDRHADQLVVEQADGTRRTSAADIVRGAPVGRRPIPINGKKMIQWTASTTTSKLSLLLMVRAQPGFENAELSQIEMEVRACSGGGGGSWGGTAGYGGFPGFVVEGSIFLDQLQDGDITITVGAGAWNGSDGGYSTWGSPYDPLYIYAPGPKRGGNNDAEENAFQSFLQPYGLRMGPRSWGGSAYPDIRPSQDIGPGGGGAHAASRHWIGGTSSVRFPEARVATDFTIGARGKDMIADNWDSYGSGGNGHSTTGQAGGDGGFPGGGGGGSRTTSSPPTGSGVGGNGKGANGDVRARFWLWEGR